MNAVPYTDHQLAIFARDAVRLVAEDIRESFGAVASETKRTLHDPVTEVDRRSETRIRAFLERATPEAWIAGEEFGATGPEGSRLHWHIDPIDGTHNFVAGVPYVSTSVGAELDGRIVAGAVHDPLRGETFWASSTEAWVDDVALPSVADFPGHAGLMTAQPFQGVRPHPADLGDLLDLFAEAGVVRNPGSFALQLAHVAAGRATTAFESVSAPWDIAGGVAIAQAVGCAHIPLADAPAGYGDWAGYAYLITRDLEQAPATADRLRGVLDRGTMPAWLRRVLAG